MVWNEFMWNTIRWGSVYMNMQTTTTYNMVRQYHTALVLTRDFVQWIGTFWFHGRKVLFVQLGSSHSSIRLQNKGGYPHVCRTTAIPIYSITLLCLIHVILILHVHVHMRACFLPFTSGDFFYVSVYVHIPKKNTPCHFIPFCSIHSSLFLVSCNLSTYYWNYQADAFHYVPTLMFASHTELIMKAPQYVAYCSTSAIIGGQSSW